MNTFEKHFCDFQGFVEKILSWGPDYLVPVAKKGCKLIKTLEHLPQLQCNPELIKYRSFFELTNPLIQGRKVAVLDDATQYTATLQEYRRYFENHGATVRTFSFVGHEGLFTGKRWKEDPLAEIARPLPEPVYQEYILQQSYHLLKSGYHFDLDHLIFEINLPPNSIDRVLNLMMAQGELLFVEDYFLRGSRERFSLNQPRFFQGIPFLEAPSISLGAVRKVKCAYDRTDCSLCFSPLVFPTWDFCHQDVGSALLQNVPFALPYKVPVLLDKRNKDSLLRVYYDIYFACVVSFAKAFIQTILAQEGLSQTVSIKRNDLDAVLGVQGTDDLISSVKGFVCGSRVYDFSGPITRRRRAKSPRWNDFAGVIDELKGGYERKVRQCKSRVGVHYYLSYDKLFREFRDPVALSSDLDYYCDFGVIVPEVFRYRGRLLRGCRAGEPNPDYNWKRTQMLIPLAIDQFCAELKRRSNEVEPTILNKLLANFVFDYPSEELHELHSLFGSPYTFGTLVGVYHRHRAPNKPSIYQAERISPYYEWNRRKDNFSTKDKRRMIREISSVFDNGQQIPYSEIVTYFRLLSAIYRKFKTVDVLNMLSICRDENCFYSHVLYNLRTSLEDFGIYIDTDASTRYSYLISSKTNARSAFDKLGMARKIDETMKRVTGQFGREVEYVKAVEMLRKHYEPFGDAFRMTLQQVEEIVILELILTNLCLYTLKPDAACAEELKSLDARRVLARNGITLPGNISAFLQNAEEQQEVVTRIHNTITAKVDALPLEERPMLSARLRNERRRQARNSAISYVYQAGLLQACLLYVDFYGSRLVPEPKEELLSRHHNIVELNADRAGGTKLYGAHGSDTTSIILFSDVAEAIQCASEIKENFSEDLFLHSGRYDVRFGISFMSLDAQHVSEQMAKLWGNAKDCCEYQSPKFRNHGDLLASQETLDLLRSGKDANLVLRFAPVQGVSLRSGSQVFRFVDIHPMVRPEPAKTGGIGPPSGLRGRDMPHGEMRLSQSDNVTLGTSVGEESRGVLAKSTSISPRMNAMNQCKILFCAANPNGTARLALDEECREIDYKIRAAEGRDSLELITKWAVRPDDLLQYLNQYQPHVVHFSGHGSPTEEIVLFDASQRPKPVSKAALKNLFATLKDNIRVVVLNACYSRPQAQAITEVIDCAIGMKRAIGDKAAITFAAAFYRAIGFRRSVQDAFDQARTALMLEGIGEADTPELLVRKGVNARTLFLT